MKKAPILAFLIAAISFQVGPTAATASPITYQLIGVMASFGSTGTDTITGNFTYDPTTTTLDAVNIMISGSVGASTYTVPETVYVQAGPPTETEISFDNGANTYSATLDFIGLLGIGDYAVASLLIVLPPFHFGEGQLSQSATGFAATPLPAALPLFGTGLGGLGLLGWRRKRKVPAGIAVGRSMKTMQDQIQ